MLIALYVSISLTLGFFIGYFSKRNPQKFNIEPFSNRELEKVAIPLRLVLYNFESLYKKNHKTYTYNGKLAFIIEVFPSGVKLQYEFSSYNELYEWSNFCDVCPIEKPKIVRAMFFERGYKILSEI